VNMSNCKFGFSPVARSSMVSLRLPRLTVTCAAGAPGANLDDAFTRRLDTVVDFPLPDEAARLALWQRCLAPPVPTNTDLDLDFYARSFPVSGGNIRSAAITAAYLAAETGSAIDDEQLTAAIQQEYRKLRRLLPTTDSASK